MTGTIRNRLTSELFVASVRELLPADFKTIKKKDWLFEWNQEKQKAEVRTFGLYVEPNRSIFHGLISLRDNRDHIFVELLESNRLNQGKDKVYEGVSLILMAWACALSFERGYDGFVCFTAKSALIPHYQKIYQARLISRDRMIIESTAAKRLVDIYLRKQ